MATTRRPTDRVSIVPANGSAEAPSRLSVEATPSRLSIEKLVGFAAGAAAAAMPLARGRSGLLSRALPALFGSGQPAAAPLAARHPLAPAAVRVERSRSLGRRGGRSDQTAVTVWFGVGPALPAPGSHRSAAATAVRIGAGLLGAATVAAATAAAARLGDEQERRRRLLDAPPGPPRVGSAEEASEQPAALATGAAGGRTEGRAVAAQHLG